MSAESKLVGTIDQHEQVTLKNSTGAALAANEVFSITNAASETVAYVAREAIANNANGEANIKGEFDLVANSTSTFEVGDPVYWKTSGNYAIARSEAKTGDFLFGPCTQRKVSGTSYVRARLNGPSGGTALSVSSSSVSSASSSSTSA